MILDMVKQIELSSGRIYYQISDFMFIIKQRASSVTSIAHRIDQSEMLPIGVHTEYQKERGRNSTRFCTKRGIEQLVSRTPSIPISIKKELGVFNESSSEAEFVHALSCALDCFGIKYELQYGYMGYAIDFLIEEYGIAVEYDEYSHPYKGDEQREAIIRQKFKIVRCSAVVNTGTHIGNIIKMILC